MTDAPDPSAIPRHYFYLHGFCSGPQSAKAKYFQQRFNYLGIPLILPDLNEPAFETLTLTRQIEQVQSLLPPYSTTLIGSSLGGLVAALLAEKHPQIDRLVLLAPALNFLDHWLPAMGETVLAEWKHTGSRSLYHYDRKENLNLSYQFIEDVQHPNYRAEILTRSCPTLILHGTEDEVIPIEMSREYAQKRSWVKLVELPSDHSLSSQISLLWRHTFEFLWS